MPNSDGRKVRLEAANNSDTAVVVLHEIYGLNDHIAWVSRRLAKHKFSVIAPNLLDGREPFSYEQAEIAYDFFMENVGFANALKQAKAVLDSAKSNYQQVYVLGYSIGATLAWLLSEVGLCDLVIGFYGSRIRDYLTIKPQCPCLLFFPTSEQSFNVDELMFSLSHINNVQLTKLYGSHGFADPFSKNYNKESATRACKEIKSIMTHGW